MEKEKELSTVEEVRAYTDPYRIEILFNFKRLGRPATCKEIADVMGEVPAKVYYHIKKMEKVGILKLAHTKNINGIIAKYYELTAESFIVKNKYDANEPISSVKVNESIRVLSDIFDKAKNDFIEGIQPDTKKGHNRNCVIEYSEIYMTDDEAKEFHEYVDDFIKKREHTQNGDHRVFFAMIKNRGDKEKSK
ncbi:helix-turn-helix domain-containing protein [Clostridium hydrogenum]|uniref:helix-turn-helix domain-containing protein n=1 Tax=Clostridium hydrogenum TaxID=2855764 RepID=UPI002E3737C8|nr:helix-turn-helix domain-containing protein [Clostridium hydrogenum]